MSFARVAAVALVLLVLPARAAALDRFTADVAVSGAGVSTAWIVDRTPQVFPTPGGPGVALPRLDGASSAEIVPGGLQRAPDGRTRVVWVTVHQAFDRSDAPPVHSLMAAELAPDGALERVQALAPDEPAPLTVRAAMADDGTTVVAWDGVAGGVGTGGPGQPLVRDADAPAAIERPALSVAPDGAALLVADRCRTGDCQALVWDRTAAGTWSAPVTLPGSDRGSDRYRGEAPVRAASLRSDGSAIVVTQTGGPRNEGPGPLVRYDRPAVGTFGERQVVVDDFVSPQLAGPLLVHGDFGSGTLVTPTTSVALPQWSSRRWTLAAAPDGSGLVGLHTMEPGVTLPAVLRVAADGSVATRELLPTAGPATTAPPAVAATSGHTAAAWTEGAANSSVALRVRRDDEPAVTLATGGPAPPRGTGDVTLRGLPLTPTFQVVPGPLLVRDRRVHVPVRCHRGCRGRISVRGGGSRAFRTAGPHVVVAVPLRGRPARVRIRVEARPRPFGAPPVLRTTRRTARRVQGPCGTPVTAFELARAGRTRVALVRTKRSRRLVACSGKRRVTLPLRDSDPGSAAATADGRIAFVTYATVPGQQLRDSILHVLDLRTGRRSARPVSRLSGPGDLPISPHPGAVSDRRGVVVGRVALAAGSDAVLLVDEAVSNDGSRVRIRRITADDDRVIDSAPGIDPGSLRGGARFSYRRGGVLITPPAAP